MSPSQTNEQALEAAIEKALCGISREELLEKGKQFQEPAPLYPGERFIMGNNQDFDAHYAIDKNRFWSFLEKSQPDELDKLKRSSDYQLKILERFDKIVKKYGVLRVLKKGLDVEDAHFTFLYQLPISGASKKVKELFALNEFSVSRQIQYNQENLREEIDMVIFINGIAIASLELKNPWTGQNARSHGIRQYTYERDHRQPLLQFGRCLVHFALDPDEAYMTTKLNGAKTFFLPFNKGNNFGKGNPPNPFGHRSAYLWEEVFSKKSLAGIIQHFVRFDGKANDAISKRTLFFPRYQQLDVVRKLIDHTSQNGTGHTYLIQHSAGSGKSNSITWAAYQLIEVYQQEALTNVSVRKDKPLFDSVVVVTDRRLLDKQLKENISNFSEVKNIIAPAHSSLELKKSLEQGKKIIITTIQKFPFIVEGIDDLSDKNFAVIIDEAHSSQSGTAAGKMNQALGKYEEEEDEQDKILKAIKSAKMKGNASYFAFTATPKSNTLERFGVKKEDGSFESFHLYSMKQAIEEGFILDVLANYTTYRSYYEIEKSVEDNPAFDTQKAQKKLKAYVEKDKRTIATKAEIVIEHFISKIYKTKKLKGFAKAMVVTQSIESAIRYYLAIKKILTEKSNPFKILIAFSGSKEVDGIEYSETSINGFPEKDTRIKFEEDQYRILVVANKYLTGFDQPKLCTMYVDKKLQGVLAVQALSRLNRSALKYGKKTEDLFVLDFFNETSEIKTSFDPYYTSTTLSEATDVSILHDLQDLLGEVGVYEWSEVEEFNQLYFNGEDAQLLSPVIDIAANRFNVEIDLEDEQKADFKIKSKQFVKIYGQMASIIPFEVVSWEKLYWFLKFLIPKLIVINREDTLIDELLESVDLSTYGLERTRLNQSISLEEANTELDPQNPNPRGAHGGELIEDLLDDIIRVFNDRFYSGWDETPEESRVKFVSRLRKIQNHIDFNVKVADNPDQQNSDLALRKILDDVMLQERKANMEEYKRAKSDDAYYQGMFDLMKRMIDYPGFLEK